MEVDGVHAVIEKKKKKLPGMSIQTPREWAQFVRTCQMRNKPFIVHEMAQEDFVDWSTLYSGKSELVVRKVNTLGEPFIISTVIHCKAQTDHPGSFFYKTSFDQDDFKEVSYKRKKREDLHFYDDLLPLRIGRLLPIKKLKFDNLMNLLQWVDARHHDFL